MIVEPNDLVKTDEYICEEVKTGLFTLHSIKENIFSGSSDFQKVNVCNLKSFDKCLLIDGHMQSSESDEFIYHECLVTPAMVLHPNPKKVFIAGGGEGATAREILRFKSVEKVVMVDIDPIVMEVSKQHLPQHHAGVFENPKLQVICADAKTYLEQTEEKFDVIISDLPDPLEGGPCALLYTQNFYKMIKTRLTEKGVLAIQSGPGGHGTMQQSCTPIYRTLSTVFSCVTAYFYHVPSFADCNAFNIVSLGQDPKELTDAEVDLRISERVSDPKQLQFYDGQTHRHLFSLPKHVRQILANETDVITETNPKYCYKE